LITSVSFLSLSVFVPLISFSASISSSSVAPVQALEEAVAVGAEAEVAAVAVVEIGECARLNKIFQIWYF